VAVKIKLKRLGKIHAPQYRIVVADSRTARGGRAIEEVGVYQPLDNPSVIQVDSERIQYWLGVGAQPTEAVTAILKVTGDWQRFKGLPGAEGTLEVAPAKPNKMIAFEAAVKSAADAPKTPRPKAAPAAVAAVEEVVSEVADAVVEAVQDVVEAVEEVVSDVVEAVEHAIEDVTERSKDESAEKSD